VPTQDGLQTHAPMPTKIVIYISKAVPDLARPDIERLMFEARGLNAINGVRGILTYDDRGFLQAIEGTSDAIDDIVARILADPRHYAIEVLLDAPTDGLQFDSFTDVLCPPGRLADPATFADWVLARLSGDVAAAIGRGYAMLGERQG
jgi:hypothetical protein